MAKIAREKWNRNILVISAFEYFVLNAYKVLLNSIERFKRSCALKIVHFYYQCISKLPIQKAEIARKIMESD